MSSQCPRSIAAGSAGSFRHAGHVVPLPAFAEVARTIFAYYLGSLSLKDAGDLISQWSIAETRIRVIRPSRRSFLHRVTINRDSELGRRKNERTVV
jgi:hypothetical protein